MRLSPSVTGSVGVYEGTIGQLDNMRFRPVAVRFQSGTDNLISRYLRIMKMVPLNDYLRPSLGFLTWLSREDSRLGSAWNDSPYILLPDVNKVAVDLTRNLTHLICRYSVI